MSDAADVAPPEIAGTIENGAVEFRKLASDLRTPETPADLRDAANRFRRVEFEGAEEVRAYVAENCPEIDLPREPGATGARTATRARAGTRT